MAEKAAKSKSKKSAILNRSANSFPVVGIGASAGGLEAFKKLLKAIPEKSGMAYVFVQHLDPTHESKLTALIQKVTAIPVIKITNEITIQPDHIYIIPGNKMLTVKENKLILKAQPAKNKIKRNQTIDIFFTSLALTHEGRAIGIVLSGTASDGTKGLKAIKDYGGFTIAQSKGPAAYQGMPQSAIDAGVADFILAPEKISQKLLDIAKAIAGKEAMPGSEEDVFKEILSILRIRKGMDFTYYKQTTIRRRIIRRMVLNKYKTIGTYVKYLQENTTEQDALYQDMLIPVTSFFRDTKAFENLCEAVFPNLIKNKTADGIIRIWVAGCSTGEEAYSIAICFKEYLGHKKEKIQIFATDLSEAAIVKARSGIYSKADAEAVSPARLKEYFTYTQGAYQVNKELRDMCVFAVHNFLKDPPFSRIDFVSCRNVLIYMDTYLQKKALTTFHYALNPKGLLMLGKSENTIGITDLFAGNGKNEKIFIRKDVPSRMVPVMTRQTEKMLPEIKSNYTTEIVRTDFQKIADDIMLREYIPAAVVINESLDIVHSRGTTSFYLELFPGKPSLNLLKMAKMGLAFELRSIVHKVKKDKKIHKKDNIPVRINKTEYDISIEVRPLPHTIEPYYLVLFDRKPVTNKITSAKAAGKTNKDDYALRIQQLEQELTLLREDMRTITEDQEASNEELQSTNEELLSSNEELQSLNEELETSKEELQSTVEELTVVNQEMVNLNEQLAFEKESVETARKQLEESENKFRQLADSLPLLVWQTDAQGNQTFASARWKEFTGLDPENADSFEKMVHPDDIEGIVKAWTNSLTTGATYRHEVRLKSKEGKYHWFQVHGEPLYNDKKEVEKWVGAFTDITDRKEAEQGIKESEEKFSTLAENMENLAWLANGDGWIHWYNKRWYDYTGTTVEEMQGWGWEKVHHPGHLTRVVDFVKKAWKKNEPWELTFPLRGVDGEYRWFLTRAFPIADETGIILRWIGTNTNIDERKKAEDLVKESEERFRTLADESPMFVFIIDSDPMAPVSYWNKTWLDYTGQTFEQALGRAWDGIIHHDDVPVVMDIYVPAFENQQPYLISSIRVLRHDGEYRWHSFKGNPRYMSNGKFNGYVGVGFDIHEQKLAEDALKESEEKFSTLADNMENLAWIADGEGWIYWYNKRWLEYTGLTLEEMQGWGWQKVHHPDHVDRILEISKKIWDVNETFEITFPLRRHDGEFRWFLTRGRPIADANGKVIRWLGTNTDITEQMEIAEDLKKTKEQLELTFRNVPAAIYHFDKNGKILYLNEKGATQMGYASAQDVLEEKDIFQFRKKLDETYLVLDQSGNPLPIEQSSAAITFRTNQPSEIVAEMRNRATDNSFWLLSKSAPLFNEAGELIMVLTTSTDITFQKTTEKTLRYRQALLEAHNEASFDGILLVDAKGKILSYNHKFIEIWNMPQHIVEAKDDEAALAFAMTQLVHPEQFKEKVKWLYEHPTETSKDLLEYKDGKIVERHGYPVVAEDGSYYAWSWTFRDITEQTQAEIKIKESEKQLRKTTEHFEIATTAAEVGTWSLDIPSETLVWSGLHKKMWGYDEQRTDLLYEDWHKVILPGDKEDAFAEVAKALDTKTLYEASYRIKRSDNGDVRWIRSLGQYFYNDAGEPVTLTGVSIDITEQKKAEIALKESENLYHNLIYSSPSAIGVLKGEDLVITTANDAIIEIWGKGEEIMGKKYFEALPELAEQGYKEVFAEVYKTGIPFNAVETPVHILQKGKMTLKYYNFLLYAQRNIYDTIDGIGIIATEVTSQAILNKQIQENEKRFRLLADSMPQHIWTADVKGNLNYFNQSVYDYSGLTLQQINKDGWLQIVHPDDREENIRQWIESVTKGTDFLFEHRFRRYDGEYRWQLSRAVPQKDADGNITMWVGTSTDIQKIKEEEQRKDDFLKMVSHELKTPVTSIKGYVQFLLSLMKDQAEPESSAFPLKSSLMRVDIQILRLTRLITEMLDLSRIESGQLELQKESFNLNGLVTETIKDILHTSKSHRINLQEDFNFTVAGDRDRIGQVLINFINNAVKYSPGKDTVDVRIYKASENQVAVSVKDYGIGIGKEDHEKIFERFYRVSGENQQNFSGFGIGLFIANEVIQRHHGNITVESEKGKGSVFTFILPLSVII